MNIGDLSARLRAFARERDWEQFHTPKNLAMALAVEAKIRVNAAKYPVEKSRGSVKKYSELG